MTTKDKFVFPCFGTDYECQFVTGKYGNGNLALEIVGAEGSEYEGEPIFRVTVNPGQPIPTSQIAIKDYSENEGMVDFCKKLGIIGNLVHTVHSGWVEIPIYELTEGGKEIFAEG